MKTTNQILNNIVTLEATTEDINACIRHIAIDNKELNFENLFSYLNFYVFELGFLNNYTEKSFNIKNIYDATLDTLENLNINFDLDRCFNSSYSIVENRFNIKCLKIVDNSLNDLLIKMY